MAKYKSKQFQIVTYKYKQFVKYKSENVNLFCDTHAQIMVRTIYRILFY